MPGRGRRVLSTQAARSQLIAAERNRHRIVAFGCAAVVAFVVYLIVPIWLSGATRYVAAYDAGTLALLAIYWLKFVHEDPQKSRDRAAADDPGRNVVFLIVLLAVISGLVSAIAIIGHGPKVHTELEKWEAYVLGVIAISAGWFLVHTIYTFRYAHLYWYDDDGDGTECGGIRFPGTDQPSDWDFAYFSFTLGTSFAVSDPQVTETRVRREVIGHSIISFAYNSVIVGMVINLLAGIFSATTGGGDGGPK
ncbi:MAG: DUF1345 domain-containing protein [Candidatus Eremiobacteraeota bacterium]|nr:DUF1345 domain-containing protein [Candidatus Eremiobacteraeota bacterium]